MKLPNSDNKVDKVKQDDKSIICNVANSGAISVELIGQHMDKRTLLRAIKAIKLKYRQSIILYRKQMIADRSKNERENKRETKEGVITNEVTG